MVSMLKSDKQKEIISPTPKHTFDLIKLVFFFVNTDESVQHVKSEKKETSLKTTVIENLILILSSYIEYDAGLVNFYVQSLENCLLDIKSENLSDNLKKIYHFREMESFAVYCKANFILTYNLMILIEYTRSDSQSAADCLRLGHLLKELILNQDSLSLIEKKYVFQLFSQLYLLNKLPNTFIRADKDFLNKIIEMKSSTSLNDSLVDNDDTKFTETRWFSKTIEQSVSASKCSTAWSIKKYLKETCEELLWVIILFKL